MEEKKKRTLVIPGEVIVSGMEYLPSDGTRREKDNIVASRFGLAEIEGRLVRIIPLSGPFIPRRGNIVIGKVTDVTFNGWVVDINAPYPAFLPVSESGQYVNKNDLSAYLDIGDMITAKVFSIKNRGIDLSMDGRGFGKIEDGIIISINSNKVPRVIGKDGSMVNMIKEKTNCDIIVGQNGLIWIRGDNVETELLARKAIEFLTEKTFIEGLTEKVEEFISRSK